MRGRQAIVTAGVLVAFVVIVFLVVGSAQKYTALIASALVLGVLLLMNRLASGRARAFHATNKEALAALARGDFAGARMGWERWITTRRAPRIEALARHNVAWTLIRDGELERAIAMLEANEARNLSALDAIGLSATSAADRALAHALRGDLTEAQPWLDRAAERMLKATIPSAGALALAAAVVHCRAGRIAEATKLLDEQWTELEATTPGDVLRPLRIVRAFAHAAAGPRSAGMAETAIASARPAYPSEYAFLGVDWPEMDAFLMSHDLVRRPSEAATANP